MSAVARSSVEDRVPRRWLQAASCAVLAAVMLQQPGRIGHETKLDLVLDPGKLLSRAWHLWDARSDFGHVPNQVVGYAFPRGPFFLAGSWLGLPAWVTERIYVALLIVVALWGLTRLADALRIGTHGWRLIAGAAYALSPVMMSRVGVISGFVDGYVMVPWIVLPLVTVDRIGSARRAAALSGIAVVCVGGLNAAVNIGALVLPAVWLIWGSTSPVRSALRRWWVLSVGLASAWWAVPLLYQSRYFFDFLPFTEQPDGIARYPSAFTGLVGTGDWLGYISDGRPWLPGAWLMGTHPVAIAGVAVVAALGVAGLCRIERAHRSALVISLTIGLCVVTAGYRFGFGASPLASRFVDLSAGPLGVIRSTVKFQSAVTLPLALGVAQGGTVAARWASGRTGRGTRRLLSGVVAVAAAASVLPVWTGRLMHTETFVEVPTYWRQVAEFADRNPQIGRILVIPGIAQGDYNWGRTIDEPFRSYSERPTATRSSIPLGSGGSIALLDVIERAIEKGGDPELGVLLRRAGIGAVLARYDVPSVRWGAPDAFRIRLAMSASGFGFPQTFGRAAEFDRLADGRTPALEMFFVEGFAETAVTVPIEDLAVLVGGPQSLLQAVDLPGFERRPFVVSSDATGADRAGRDVVVSDAVRRTHVTYGITRNNSSYLLASDESAAGGDAASVRFDDGIGVETVGSWSGVESIGASSYGSWFVSLPEYQPGAAMDGDPDTWWQPRPAVSRESRASWWRVELDTATSVSSVDVSFIRDSPLRPLPSHVEVRTERGVETVMSADGLRSFQVRPDGAATTRFVEVRILETVGGDPINSGVALSEVSIPGVSAKRYAVLPPVATEPGSGAPASQSIVMSRAAASQSSLRSDEEQTLRRRFSTVSASTYALAVRGTSLPGDALNATLDELTGLRLDLRVSSVAYTEPWARPSLMFDASDFTSWIAATDDSAPTIELAWPREVRLDRFRLSAGAAGNRPLTIELRAGNERRVLTSLPRQGLVRFAPLTADAMTIVVTKSTDNTTSSALTGGSEVRLPTSIDTLSFPTLSRWEGSATIDTRRVSISCDEGPTISLDDRQIRLRASTTFGALSRREQIRFTPCVDGGLPIPAGDHELVTVDGISSRIDEIGLVDELSVGEAPGDQRILSAQRETATESRYGIGPGGVSLLILNHNFNIGWEAVMRGGVLRPIRIDGWRQGFVVPAGEGGEIEVSFAPTRTYRVLLIGAALLLIALLGLAVRPAKRRHAVDRAPLPRPIPTLIAAVATLLVGGVVGLGIGLVVMLAVRRWGISAAVLCGLAGLTVAGGAAVIGAGDLPGDRSGPFGWAAQVGVAMAVAALLSSASRSELGSADHV